MQTYADFMDEQDKKSKEFAESVCSGAQDTDAAALSRPRSSPFSLANLVVPIVGLLVAIGAGVYMYLLTTSVSSLRVPRSSLGLASLVAPR
jgi:hypothetical protein